MCTRTRAKTRSVDQRPFVFLLWRFPSNRRRSLLICFGLKPHPTHGHHCCCVHLHLDRGGSAPAASVVAVSTSSPLGETSVPPTPDPKPYQIPLIPCLSPPIVVHPCPMQIQTFSVQSCARCVCSVCAVSCAPSPCPYLLPPGAPSTPPCFVLTSNNEANNTPNPTPPPTQSQTPAKKQTTRTHLLALELCEAEARAARQLEVLFGAARHAAQLPVVHFLAAEPLSSSLVVVGCVCVCG